MIVLDASALVDVVLDQDTKPWVLEQLAGRRVAAPAHQLAEVLSAVARTVRSGVVSRSTGLDALREAGALDQEVVPLTGSHLTRALEFQDRLRVLDALYVVVAEDLQATLVTTDQRLARAGPPVPVATPPAG